jgi:hypothetical protein
VHVGVHLCFVHTFEIGVFELNATHKHGQSQSNGHLPETINLEANNCVSEKRKSKREGHVCQIICTVIHRRRSLAAPSAEREREEQN